MEYGNSLERTSTNEERIKKTHCLCVFPTTFPNKQLYCGHEIPILFFSCWHENYFRFPQIWNILQNVRVCQCKRAITVADQFFRKSCLEKKNNRRFKPWIKLKKRLNWITNVVVYRILRFPRNLSILNPLVKVSNFSRHLTVWMR